MRTPWLYFLVAILLLGSIIVCATFFRQPNTVQSLTHEASRNLEKEMALVEQGATEFLSESDELSSPYSFFLIDSTKVIKWNRNEFLPDVRLFFHGEGWQFLVHSRGYFLIYKRPLARSQFVLGVIPLFEKYRITNRYLSPAWNESIFPIAPSLLVDVNELEGEQVCAKDKCLFKIKWAADVKNENDYFTVGAIGVSILFASIGIFLLTSKMDKKRKYGHTFLVLLLCLAVLRVLMLYFNYPGQWIALSVFDSQQFASSSYNSSLGDLFLNTLIVLVCSAYFFRVYSKLPILHKMLTLSMRWRLIASIASLLLACFSFLFSFLFVETILHNSSISLDITQSLQWDAPRIFSYASIVAGAISSFFAFHVFFRISVSLMEGSKKMFAWVLGSAVVLLYGYSYLLERNYSITIIVAAVYFSLLFVFQLYRSLSRVQPSTFLYLLSVSAALAVQGSLGIKQIEEEKLIESQFRFANNYLVSHDLLGEYLLDEASKRIERDPFIQSRMGTPFLTKSIIRQKIKQIYLKNYFDRYETKIYLYDAAGRALDNESEEDFASLLKNFQNDASKTSYPNIYFLRVTQQSIKRYLAIIPVSRASNALGFVVLDLSLKKVIPQSVYPELLTDNRFYQFFNIREFSFAFFSSNKPIGSFGDFNYDRHFNTSFLHNPEIYKGFLSEGYFHVAVDDESGKTVVVSSRAYPFFYTLTNFSFLFLIGLAVVALWILFSGVWNIVRGYRLNYSARIQFYTYLAFALPLSVLTITALSLISKSDEVQIENEYKAKLRIVSESVTPVLEAALKKDISTDQLDNEIIKVSKNSGIDFSLYDASGYLMSSSQPLIFESLLLSELINASAFKSIVGANEPQVIVEERIGKLKYSGSYAALRSSQTGKIIGILNIPFFESVYSLEKIRINVLANIITIFTIVFILFTLLSFYAARWLTYPLKLITRKLSKTTLGENIKMEWNARDEIGMMVDGYNKMVDNLENSKRELARSQKESAWREIAKQVAHEIKNPLTPMKLTLQQMEMQIIKDEWDKEKTVKAVHTLLSQVEILNEIASSFSTFARMPAPHLGKIDLAKTLRSVVSLFENKEQGHVVLSLPGEPLICMGDDQLLNRIISNIILNSLQSGYEGKPVTVKVSAMRNQNRCIVKIEDNGKGIAHEVREKIFVPHFSTKKTGSGLGLAISKQGIEQLNGKIWFDTSVNVGTTFFIELPLIH